MPPFYLHFCNAKLHESKTCSKPCHPWHSFCAGMGLRYAIGLEPSTGASAGKTRAVRSVFPEQAPRMAPSASGGGLKGGHTMCPTGSTVRLL